MQGKPLESDKGRSLTENGNLTGALPNNLKKQINFVKSIFFAVFSAIILLGGITTLVDAAIIDGSAYDNSRWGRLGDAYETIRDNDNDKVIVIGSSVSYFGFDGKCIEENDGFEIDYYNLAVRGDMPYLRILETDYIIKSGAKRVIFEAGPNTFQNGIGSLEERLRWQIFSLYNDVNKEEIGHILLKEDHQFILDNEFERLQFRQKSTGSGLDRVLKSLLVGKPNITGDGHLPSKDSPDWEDSLKTPPVSERDPLSELEWQDYIEEISNSEFWKPDVARNPNRIAFDHMIKEFEESDIEVIFLSFPVHEDLKKSISPGSWDSYNHTRDELRENYTFLDYTWKNLGRSNFLDPIHLSETGRKAMCSELVTDLAD